MRIFVAALLAAAAVQTTPANAQIGEQLAQPISGTRLEITATGEATRVPDIARISAGVVTRAATASEAIQQNAARMDRVLAALRRAGVADRDIQTSSLNLNPDYRYENNEPPKLVGYNASNQVTIRFRDIRNSGKILDALVAQGANQINGPAMTIDKPEEALDEARAKAVANGMARARLYAQALGKRVARVISLSENSGYAPPPPAPMMMSARAESADTKVVPGEQTLDVTVSMVFELQ